MGEGEEKAEGAARQITGITSLFIIDFPLFAVYFFLSPSFR